MKTFPVFQAVLVVCLLGMGRNGILSHAADPQIVNQAFVGNNVFLGLFPNSSDWVSMEGSSDLSNWITVASVASTNNVTIIHEPDARLIPQRFYRLRRPGFSVEDAQAKWTTCVESNYQFRLIHSRDFHAFTGTVTVTNGQKVITNAELDSQPVEHPAPDDYPTIEELFAKLKSAQISGCRRVAAIYDPNCGYPTWCVVELTGQSPKLYTITNFVLLNTAQKSDQPVSVNSRTMESR